MAYTATISPRHMTSLGLYRLARSHFESLAGLTVFGLVVWQGEAIAAQFACQRWNLSNFHTGVFSWASIQSGFLFAVYTFVLGRSEAFVQAIAKTPAYRKFKEFMLRTIYLTFAIALVAFYLSVASVAPTGGTFSNILFGSWCGTVVFAFAGFLKVVRSFRKLERSRA